MNQLVQLNNDYRWSECPLCHSNETSCVGRIDYREPINFSTKRVNLTYPPELYECKVCNSSFTQNVVREDVAYGMYMQGNSADKWPRHVSLIEEKHHIIIERLEQYFLKDKRVLDIGCNTGILLDHARSRGCVTYGVEPSLASLKALHNKGHVAFASMENTQDKYDVLTAFDLIEHLYDVPRFLSDTWKLLADGGVLILLTGDIRCLTARVSKQHWWYLKAPEHIVFPSITYLRGITGFRLVSIDKSYASTGYGRPLLRGLVRYVKQALLREDYDGLPSLGPDHILVVLTKVDKT